jgi:hypothetical protein
MDIDSIAEITIDGDGRLCVRPATVVLPYIWREAMQVQWDDQKGCLYSPKPREWSYADWYRQILAAAREQGCDLRITSDTVWTDVPEGVREAILTAGRLTIGGPALLSRDESLAWRPRRSNPGAARRSVVRTPPGTASPSSAGLARPRRFPSPRTLMTRIASWRPLLFAAGVLMIAGSATHPRDPSMQQMLMNPIWVPSHALMLAGYVSLLASLWLLHRSGGGPAGRWMQIALAGTALQTLEAFFHLIAVVDADRMQAGHATPVYTVHMLLGAVGYPVFALVAMALVVAGARTRTLGRWWIAPLGVLGALLPGLAAVFVIWMGADVGVLFAGIAFFGLWEIVASLLPIRVAAESSAAPRSAALAGA